jgi:riboflavin synthase
MFSGIIQSTGRVDSLAHLGDTAARLTLSIPDSSVLKKAVVGESISVNGVCLTVSTVLKEGATLQFDIITPTLQKTNLGALQKGNLVNLEPALRMGDPISGHWVTGHIDGTGKIQKIEKEGETVWFAISAHPDLLKPLIPEGSIAVDGISLTLAQLGTHSFRVGITPHTFQVTHLQNRIVADSVNLEIDVIGKYVYKYISSYPKGASRITTEFLKEHGFIFEEVNTDVDSAFC